MAAISKKLAAFCLCMLVCISLLAIDANARRISNGAMGGNTNNDRKRTHNRNCKEGKANNYQRGCEPIYRCRTHSPPPALRQSNPKSKLIYTN